MKRSVIGDNIGGIILTIVLIVIVDIAILGQSTASGGAKFLYILSNIVQLPIGFLGYLLGNKIRLWLHPDFIIADGFLGLLKERLFWRWAPQLIGTLIGIFIVAGLANSMLEKSEIKQIGRQNVIPLEGTWTGINEDAGFSITFDEKSYIMGSEDDRISGTYKKVSDNLLEMITEGNTHLTDYQIEGNLLTLKFFDGTTFVLMKNNRL